MQSKEKRQREIERHMEERKKKRKKRKKQAEFHLLKGMDKITQQARVLPARSPRGRARRAWMLTLTVLADNLDSIPSSHKTAHNHLSFEFQKSQCSPLTLWELGIYVVHTFMQEKHIK